MPIANYGASVHDQHIDWGIRNAEQIIDAEGRRGKVVDQDEIFPRD